MPEYLIQKETLDGIAAQSMALAGKSEAVSPATVIEDLTAANAEVAAQTALIKQIAAVLENKAAGGPSGVATVADIGVFTVSGVSGTCLFLKGQTWTEWAASKMNVVYGVGQLYFEAQSAGIYVYQSYGGIGGNSVGMGHLSLDGSTAVPVTDAIIDGQEYQYVEAAPF